MKSEISERLKDFHLLKHPVSPISYFIGNKTDIDMGLAEAGVDFSKIDIDDFLFFFLSFSNVKKKSTRSHILALVKDLAEEK